MRKKEILILSIVTVISIFLRYLYYLDIESNNSFNTHNIDYTLGLGKVVFKEISNNRNYDWYIDQFNTGKYNYENCGPSAAAMAVKWGSNGERGDAEVARSRYKAKGGWWSILDIEAYLKDENINYREEYFIDKLTMVSRLDKGKIILLCIDPRFIMISNNESERTGLFYPPSSGHFILVKGYKIVDDNLYFECYDPASFNSTYENGELKGKDRYYSAREVIISMSVHWNGMLVIN